MNADLNEPNIPSIEPEDFTFGDLDNSEAFQGSAESDGQVHEEGKLLTCASDFVDWYPEASQSYGKGYTFLNLFNSDENSVYCAKNPYYLFSGRKDWEIALWLLHSGLSMGKIDSFLSLEMICCYLDWADKCHHFDLGISLIDGMPCSKLPDDDPDDDLDSDMDDNHDFPTELVAIIKCPGYSCPITNYFAIVKILQHKEVGTVPVPLHTFIVGCMAFHLTYSPSIRSISVDDAAIKFGLSDLQPAIVDFLHHEATQGQDYIHAIRGARRAGPAASLPFDKIQIWFKLQLQETDFHDSSIIQPAQTLNCVPPSDVWNSGRYDSVIVNNELGYLWPTDGLHGHTVSQIRLIMRPVGKSNTDWSWKDHFLVYMYHFDGTTGACDPAMQMHLIRRAKHSVKVVCSRGLDHKGLASARTLCPFPEYVPLISGG
ncbi:uncharacterized protein BJ212DRAFT_1484180 [Suillus subaureus]|uniref:DUF6830 domain-containing protein n=1 Tax=Suillus subaureus TaxID=48587 RepID=A0A9P7E413_9AGAM|nr:uncharacterized protein BJ212DRAFT_1484180 [Suillus subaureus]KAG1810602.1 hypothetical protein BJ212DRAFT_1484180 [Suillus subaureus]